MDYLPSVISASAAILGALAGATSPVLLSRLERTRRKNSVLLSKLDEWMLALSTAQHWLNSLNQSKTMEDIRDNPLLDCARLQALTILYFRDMKPLVADYMQSLRNYYLWVVRCATSIGPSGCLACPLDTWLRMSQEYSSQTEHLCTTIQKSQDALIAAVQRQAACLLDRS